MRVVWPLLWLVPAILGVAATAWRLAGREAAVVTLLLCVVGLPAFQQFLPGRIDHHNAQIALAVAIVAATVWSDRARGAAIAAGALSGLALAIGLENLAFVALARRRLRAALRDRSRRRRRAGALRRWRSPRAPPRRSSSSSAPDHWGRTECDAIAINWAVPVVAAGLLLARGRRRVRRRAPGVARRGRGRLRRPSPALAFGLIEPRCLGGPYAMMDPALRAIWFSHINEMQPLATIMRNSPDVGGRARDLSGRRRADDAVARARAGAAPRLRASWWRRPSCSSPAS